MKKKKSYIGTLNTGYYSGGICHNIEIKTRSADFETINHAMQNAFKSAGLIITDIRSWTTNDFGNETLHVTYTSEIPGGKMSDLLHFAHDNGLRIGV